MAQLIYDYGLYSPSVEGKKLQFEKRQSITQKLELQELRVAAGALRFCSDNFGNTLSSCKQITVLIEEF